MVADVREPRWSTIFARMRARQNRNAVALATLRDFSQMALESTDPDPAYRRAYADIAKWVRERAADALKGAAP